MQSRTIDLGGPVHVLDFGGTGQPLVMVHGLGGNALNWLAVAPDFARKRRVLALDLAGFGMSPPRGRKATVEANGDLLARFLEREVDAPAIVMGNSMGGLVALIAAAKAPARVAGLVLVDPSQPLRVGMPVDWEVTRRFATYALPYFGPRYMRDWAEKRGAAGLVEDMLKLCCVDHGRVAREVFDAHVAHLDERLASGEYTEAPFLEAAKSILKIVTRPARFDALTKTDAPTLLVQGSHDRLVPLFLSKALAASRPNWTLEVIKGSGHVPMLEHPTEFLRRVNAWLDARFP